ncbi:Paf1p [Sugiyamaella lignohabitans]|uniref:Paf1p n=1 Tax=Sugiyamaella lignohabitans TaxID=796027 RepID=A0A167CNC6_9ASCO|nr:Paf1p [Sugiyamaella lignohabitans]ANB11916.1 Paf1p [Sugiyamaella lignohabitans]
MSRRQDYIARIRYQNDLPPPPCPPKLLNIPLDTSKLASSPAVLTNLVRKQPINVDIDIDLGMPLDLTEVQGIFDRGDEAGIYPSSTAPSVDRLDPKDRALLRNPKGITSVSKTQPGVSFLRRTEYISSEAVRQSSDSPLRSTALLRQKRLSVVSGPEEQLRIVENTFDASAEDLSKLKHPKKKNLKAVESWQLFPDSKMFDLQYLSVKLVGSASLSSSKRKFAPESLETAIFRQNSASNGEEWMSLYTADEETGKKLKSRLDSTEDTVVDDEEDDDQSYRFTRVQDNDIDLKLHPSSSFAEIAISFTDDGEAYYLPVVGRASLKRRRVTTLKQELINEHNIDAIDLSIREITPKESVIRDNQRSEYDKISFPYTENVDDDEDEDRPGESPEANENENDDDDEENNDLEEN